MKSKWIIHYVEQRKGVWLLSYEVRGEWKPKTRPLIDVLEQANELVNE